MGGRTDIYREVWKSVLKEPLIGYGYGAFWNVNPEAFRIGLAIGWPNIGYSENGFLEVALQLGFVGVALVAVMMVRSVYQGWRLLRSNGYWPRVGWFLSLIFLTLLSNIDAGWVLTSTTLDWALVLIACIGLNGDAHGTTSSGSVTLQPAP